VKLGARRGIEECQQQFNDSSLWNCSFVNRFVDPELPIFVNTTLPFATKETAFIHAISAAAITYELTLKCRHNIQGCKCKRRKLPYEWSKRGGTVAGCGDNIEFGEYETRRFFENLEKGNDARTAVNLHNNKVGREVVGTSLVYWCKCFGLNTACGLKKCWKILPASFEKIGAELKQKYHNAVRVWFVDNKLYEPIGNQFKVILSEDTRLVYLDPFPDYCVRNGTMGFPGMLGMTCSSDDATNSNCRSFVNLCRSCKLKPKTVEHYKQVECKYKFVRCCNCKKMCPRRYFVTTCNSYTVAVGTNKK